MNVARFIVAMLTAYLGAGLLFACWFVIFGVSRVDAAARGASNGFRLAVLPGVVAFWPLLAARLRHRQQEPPEETNAHRRAARSAQQHKGHERSRR